MFSIDTSKTVLSNATFYILNDPAIHKRLVEELEEAIPNANSIPSLPKLESLPYLDACIHECRLFVNFIFSYTRTDDDLVQHFEFPTA